MHTNTTAHSRTDHADHAIGQTSDRQYGQTPSYHTRSVITFQQSAKLFTSFRLIVHKDGGTKRYDFEEENLKVASKIVQDVRILSGGLRPFVKVGRVNR